MKTLRQAIKEAQAKKVAIGHFNISDLEMLHGIFQAAKSLNVPVLIGVSEGERDFVGVPEAVALVKSLRESNKDAEGNDYPIYLNADHSYSFERIQTAVEAGFDSVIIDGAKLPYEENIVMVKKCADFVHDYVKRTGRDALIEAELGYIGQSSKVYDKLPEGAAIGPEMYTKPEQAADFVKRTGVDLFAPAVGNVHGMLRDSHGKHLDIPRIGLIAAATGVPLVLHGGSGTVDEDFTHAIEQGIAIVHISTELRLAYETAIKASVNVEPAELAPYRYMSPAVQAVHDTALKRLKLFNNIK